jgi:hypothetical protein
MKLGDYISPINKCHHHQNKYKGKMPLQLQEKGEHKEEEAVAAKEKQ